MISAVTVRPIAHAGNERDQSGVQAGALACLAVSPAASALSENATIASTGFEYTLLGDALNFVTTGDGALHPLGRFTLDVPGSLFPAPGDRDGWRVVRLALTFSVFDGDTAPGDPDDDDLVAAFDAGGPAVTVLPLLLTGFPNQQLQTATNAADIAGNLTLGSTLADLLAAGDGVLSFSIADMDEGGNRLDFTNADQDTFSISFDLERTLAPVPLPAALLLALSALALLTLAGRRRTR
jgi:hypothetical protein